MKIYTRILIVSLLLSLSTGIQAQGFEPIQQALAKADADALAVHFDQMIEFCVNEDEYFLSSGEAKTKISSFFTTNKVIAFDLVHKGASPDKGSKYMIGTLRTANGNYRAYIYLEDHNGKSKIQEIRFDTE